MCSLDAPALEKFIKASASFWFISVDNQFSLDSLTNSLSEFITGECVGNQKQLTTLHFDSLQRLQSIQIASYCFVYVTSIRFSLLPSLKRILISNRCFYQWDGFTHPESEFQVDLCPQLESISIGSWSFHEFAAFRLICEGCRRL